MDNYNDQDCPSLHNTSTAIKNILLTNLFVFFVFLLYFAVQLQMYSHRVGVYIASLDQIALSSHQPSYNRSASSSASMMPASEGNISHLPFPLRNSLSLYIRFNSEVFSAS